MKIPNIFKETIKNIFYDKKIEIWIPETETDEEGATIETGKVKKIDEFMGNFQFATREYIQKEYGQEIEATAIITCDSIRTETIRTLKFPMQTPTAFDNSGASKEHSNLAGILVYDNHNYKIKSIIISDSHTTILVKGDEDE